MNRLAGIAVHRFGITPWEFYMLTPAEFHYAMEDYQETEFIPMQRICEMLRRVGVSVHNSTFGLKQNEVITNEKHYVTFPWEDPEYQTVEQMKTLILGLKDTPGVVVKKNGKIVK